MILAFSPPSCLTEAEITPTKLKSPRAFGSPSSPTGARSRSRPNRRPSSGNSARDPGSIPEGTFFTSRLRRISDFSPPSHHLPPPLNVTLQYLDKPLPRPPSGASTPTPTSSGPGTPQLLQNFPAVPTLRIDPSHPTAGFGSARNMVPNANATSSRALHPLSMLGVSDGTRRLGGIQGPTSPGGHNARSVSLSSTAEFGARPRTTSANDASEKARPLSTITAPSMGLRRSVSTMDLGSSDNGGASGSQRRRPKKPQLVPGVWIGDDDVRDDDEGPGWATITVTKHVLY